MKFYSLIVKTVHKTVLDQYEFTERNTRNHLAPTIGKRERVRIPYRDAPAKQNNNSKRVVRNLEEENVRTKRKCSKQSLTSAEGLALMLRGARLSLPKVVPNTSQHGILRGIYILRIYSNIAIDKKHTR